MQAEYKQPNAPSETTLREIIEALGSIEDLRQPSKVKYPIIDVILLTLTAIAGQADTWNAIEDYGLDFADVFKEHLNIQKIPSHDTIQRVMQMINPAVMQRIYLLWCDRMGFPEETPATLRGFKLLNIDGKTIRGSAGRGKKALHIESVWDPQRNVCVSQTAVDDKSNEITAIPKVLASLELDGYIVTSDAMGTQTAIASQIKAQGGDYLLALKGNHGSMYEAMKNMAADQEFLDDLKKEGQYTQKTEPAHGQIEVREYWQCDDLDWLPGKEKWAGLMSVAFERTTIKRNGKAPAVSWRFFLCSLPVEIDILATAVRGHWRIESMHNVLDTTLREDANQTVDRTAAENLNIMRKWVVSILRHMEIMRPNATLRSKSRHLSHNPRAALEMLTQVLHD